MLSDKIKALRLLFNMSQVDLGKKVGVSKQCVSNWENDNVMPSIDMLIKLATLFQTSTDYLLDLEKPTKTINVDGLSDKEIAHIISIVDDLREKNM